MDAAVVLVVHAIVRRGTAEGAIGHPCAHTLQRDDLAIGESIGLAVRRARVGEVVFERGDRRGAGSRMLPVVVGDAQS